MLKIQKSIKSKGEEPNDKDVKRIKAAYVRINNEWLKVHTQVFIFIVIFTFIIECGMGVLVVNSSLLTTTLPKYLIKYLMIPSGLNAFLMVIVMKLGHSTKHSDAQKIAVTSLNFVLVCAIIYTAHSYFSITFYGYMIAILMTAVYASYKLTSITALFSMITITLSELFIRWDTDKMTIYESTTQLSEFLISLFIIVAFSAVCLAIIRFIREKNDVSIQMEIERIKLEESIRIDPLTGIASRKAFHEHSDECFNGDRVQQCILGITDIDMFKRVNDTYGHHLGDICLKGYAKILNEFQSEVAAYRYGGDEFCLIFEHSDMGKAVETCEAIQGALSELRFDEHPKLKLSASFGLAASDHVQDDTRLFIHADQALYEAKLERDRICVFESRVDEAPAI